MKTRTAFIALMLTAGLVATASGGAITISGTGQNVSGGLDQSYQIISDTTGEITASAQAFVVTALATWGPAISGTEWIGPAADQSNATRSTSCCSGMDVYQMTFSLAGFNPSTASLSVGFLVDNAIVVTLNGTTVFSDGNGASTLDTVPNSFAINSGFIGGTNTLDFEVINGNGPTGLDIGVSGSATPVGAATPEPAAAMLMGLGLLGIAMLGISARKTC